MTDLYSIKDTATIFGLREARLRYWIQTGFIRPSVRRGGRFFYTFQDLVTVKAAVELQEAGVPMQRVRKALDSLRSGIPDDVAPSSRLVVCSDGQTLAFTDGETTFESESGQLVMAFEVSSLGDQVAKVLALPARTGGVDQEVAGGPTRPHQTPSAYQCFTDGCQADDRGDHEAAESLYRRALEIEPTLAAAHTNLGNALYRRGKLEAARDAYERALEHEPDQPEARFNLGNVLDDQGETELAIAELRRVVNRCPTFADAHYNLGRVLARVGGVAQAHKHFEEYLTIDPESEWAGHARAFLEFPFPSPASAG